MTKATTLSTMVAVFAAFLAGCMDRDPLGMRTREIQGAYQLEQWEDGLTYYVRGPANLSNPSWGVIEGTVGKLGWSGDRILVWQNDCGAGEGWRVVDTTKNEVSPLVGQDRIDRDPVLSKIAVAAAADAWQKLK